MNQTSAHQSVSSTQASSNATTSQVVQLRPPTRWHDPLQLIQNNPPSQIGRIVLWSVSMLVFILVIWAAFGKLDIIASSEGKLVPQTLVKIVQPAESGIIKELLVNEGDSVKAGQVIARLDTTLANADQSSINHDLHTQQMQVRRIQAELNDVPMQNKAGDDLSLFKQIYDQYLAHRKNHRDNVDQELALLQKAEHERKSAIEILSKYEQTLPSHKKTADAYADLEKEGIVTQSQSAEKQRAAIETQKNLDAQQATIAALNATIIAQQKRIIQLKSTYQSELQKELADIQQKIGQIQPNLAKSSYKQGLMELKAPQDGTIKDIATTTVGAVAQPGSVLMTLVPKDEQLYADVNIKNEDVGFVEVGQAVQVKIATYPFQRFGMLSGTLTHLSADATEVNKPHTTGNNSNAAGTNENYASTIATYKARIQLDQQSLIDAQGNKHQLNAGMQIVAEINQGRRSVLEYLLSPVQKAINEAGRER
ncbi:HlyD family type I secretion periplasmic adaptor subunit [Undibacterium fentianense]|uniref:Membrane fusion protein (MFP) family protein n=1 Tax=Undibacterium fentianense TaxID=2828728 RepID=A0A941IFC9_9BURK|nr:HlyD family type I secretion periplasmic adaptor subunit [Undibacterium fentianense]MBR7798915.1 HlyD family type I secretion periplasmic adaptor subunit [Undibacterium fentianense]